jgi:zinc D-Ala-D-Ala carboxypeptidase
MEHNMGKITKNFTSDEMKCPCCGECEMDREFMTALQQVRSECGFGFRVNSAYRCGEYNAKVSKNTRGQHTTGQAVDISMKDRYKRYDIIMKAMNVEYFKDIAIAKTFVHLGKGNVKNGIGVY